MKVIKRILLLAIFFASASLQGMAAAASLAKKVIAKSLTTPVVEKEIKGRMPLMQATVDVKPKQQALMMPDAEFQHRMKQSVNLGKQKSELIRQTAQSSSKFQDNFLALTQIARLSLANGVWDLGVIKEHLTFLDGLQQLPTILTPAEQAFIIDLLKCMCDKTGAYQGVTPSNQRKIINLLKDYYYTFCDNDSQYREKLSQLAEGHSSCVPLLTRIKEVNFRYIPDAEKANKAFKQCIAKFKNHPFNKQLLCIIDCLEKNDIQGVEKLLKEFGEANRKKLNLTEYEIKNLTSNYGARLRAYNDGLKLIERLHEIVENHFRSAHKPDLSLGQEKRSVNFDAQFSGHCEAQAQLQKKISQLKDYSKSLKKAIPQAKELIDACVSQLEGRSINSIMYGQIFDHLVMIAQDVSLDDTICLLKGLPAAKELLKYEGTILQKVLGFAQDIDNPDLINQKAELKRILFQLVQLWNDGCQYPEEYKTTIEAFCKNSIEGQLRTLAKTTEDIKESSKEPPKLPRALSASAQLGQLEYASPKVVDSGLSQTGKSLPMDAASVDLVATGRKTVESRDNYTPSQQCVLEARMIAQARTANAIPNSNTQEVINDSVHRFSEQLFQLPTYATSDPDSVVEDKLAMRMKYGMETFKKGAEQLQNQKEVMQLFNGIMDCIDAEYKKVYPYVAVSILKNLGNALELPSDRIPTAGEVVHALEIIGTRNFNNIKYTIAGLPHIAQATARFAWSLTSNQGRQNSFDCIAGVPDKLNQLYLVWNQLSTQEQKELCAQKAADLLLVAPSEVGMWVYGGKVLNVAGKSAADVARAGAKVANPLWTGVMAGVGRVRNSPIAHSIRNSLVRFERSHLQDGFVRCSKGLSWGEFLPMVQKLEGAFGKEIMDMALKISKLTEKNIANRANVVESISELAQNLKKIHSNPRWKEFLFDAAKGGAYDLGTVQEALAGIACEEQGLTKMLYRSKHDAEEFIEKLTNTIQEWDVKTPYSYSPTQKNRYIFNGREFVQEKILNALNRSSKENLIISIASTSSSDLSKLLKEMKSTLNLSHLQKIIVVDYIDPTRSMNSAKLIEILGSL